MKITVQDILALNPCEDWRARIPSLVGKGLTPHQIAVTDKVEPVWRYWALTRLVARTETGRRKLVLWACGVAQDVRRGNEDQLDAADTAIQTAVAWAEGVEISRDELWSAASAATADAASAAAADAAYAANAANAAADASYAAAYAAYAATAAAGATVAAATAAAAAAYAVDTADKLHIKWLTELAAVL